MKQTWLREISIGQNCNMTFRTKFVIAVEKLTPADRHGTVKFILESKNKNKNGHFFFIDYSFSPLTFFLGVG